MNCWHCKKELIWGGDADVEENPALAAALGDIEKYSMETNLSCPGCGSFVLVYYPRDKK